MLARVRSLFNNCCSAAAPWSIVECIGKRLRGYALAGQIGWVASDPLSQRTRRAGYYQDASFGVRRSGRRGHCDRHGNRRLLRQACAGKERGCC